LEEVDSIRLVAVAATRPPAVVCDMELDATIWRELVAVGLPEATMAGVVVFAPDTSLEAGRGNGTEDVEVETVTGGPRVGGARTDVRLSKDGMRGRGLGWSRLSSADVLDAVLLFNETAGLRLGTCRTRSSGDTPIPGTDAIVSIN
jgi:hypothetical protein